MGRAGLGIARKKKMSRWARTGLPACGTAPRRMLGVARTAAEGRRQRERSTASSLPDDSPIAPPPRGVQRNDVTTRLRMRRMFNVPVPVPVPVQCSSMAVAFARCDCDCGPATLIVMPLLQCHVISSFHHLSSLAFRTRSATLHFSALTAFSCLGARRAWAVASSFCKA